MPFHPRQVLALALAAAVTVEARHRILCPAATSSDAGLKIDSDEIRKCAMPEAAAGVGPFPKTVLQPGPLTLHWEEFRSEPASPFVITLVKYTANNQDFSTCALLDHVPHNAHYEGVRFDATDDAEGRCTEKGVNADLSRDLTGGCKTDYYVTVQIPNVICEHCAIVITSPTGVFALQPKKAGMNTTRHGRAAHEGPKECTHKFQPGDGNGEGANGNDGVLCGELDPLQLPTYGSCSKIEIRPSPGATGAAAANAALQEGICTDAAPNWPYSELAGYAPGTYRQHTKPYSPLGWPSGEPFYHEAQHFLVPDDRGEGPTDAVVGAPWARQHKCAARAVHFSSTLNTDNENFAVDPVSNRELSKVSPIGTVAATAVTSDSMRLSFAVDGLSSPVAGVHIHGPACENSAEAPVIADITASFVGARAEANLTGRAPGTGACPNTPLGTAECNNNPEDILGYVSAEIIDESTVSYVVENKPDAVLAGLNILPATEGFFSGPATRATGEVGGDKTKLLPINADQQFPPLLRTIAGAQGGGNLTFGTGTMTVTLNFEDGSPDATGVDYVIELDPSLGEPPLGLRTAIHFHGPARRFETGPPLGEEGEDATVLTVGGGGGTFTFPPDEAGKFTDMFRAGLVYVNVHTVISPGGEARGQVEFVKQSVPVDTGAHGGSRMRRDHRAHTVAKGVWKNVSPASMHALRSGLVDFNLIMGSELSATMMSGRLNFPGSTSSFTFDGRQVTDPVTTRARASARVDFVDETDQLGVRTVHAKYLLEYHGVESIATMAHIHGPAGRGIDAPALVFHPIPLIAEAASGTVSGTWKPTPSLPRHPDATGAVLDLRLGLSYFNIHSTAHPAGELRGQIEFTCSDQQWPPHVDSAITLDQGTVDLVMRERAYINLHTDHYPSGEIRGQLRVAGVHAKLTGAAQRPAPVATKGGGSWRLDALDGRGRAAWSFAAAKLSSPITAMHIHGPAAPNEVNNIAPFLLYDTNAGLGTGSNAPLHASILLKGKEGQLCVSQPDGTTLEHDGYGMANVKWLVGEGSLSVDVTIVGDSPAEFELSEVNNQGEPIGEPLGKAEFNGDAAQLTLETLSAPIKTALRSGKVGIVVKVLKQTDLRRAAHTAACQLVGRIRFGEHLEGELELNAGKIRDLYDGLLYVNAHTEENGNGEVRGQVTPPAAQSCSANSPATLKPNACLYTRLSPEFTAPPLRTPKTEMPRMTGSAGFRIVDSGVLEYSIAIENSPEQAPERLAVYIGVAQPGLPDGPRGTLHAHEVRGPPTPSNCQQKCVYTGSWASIIGSEELLEHLSHAGLFVGVDLIKEPERRARAAHLANGTNGTTTTSTTTTTPRNDRDQVLRGQIPALAPAAPGAGSAGGPSTQKIITPFTSAALKDAAPRTFTAGTTLVFRLNPGQVIVRMPAENCINAATGALVMSADANGVCSGGVRSRRAAHLAPGDCAIELTEDDAVSPFFLADFTRSDDTECKAGAKMKIQVIGAGGVLADALKPAEVGASTGANLGVAVATANARSRALAEYNSVVGDRGFTAEARKLAAQACQCIVDEAEDPGVKAAASAACAGAASTGEDSDSLIFSVGAAPTVGALSAVNNWVIEQQLAEAFTNAPANTARVGFSAGASVPPTSSGGSASGSVTVLPDSSIEYAFTVSNLDTSATGWGAHFHGPAQPGKTGGVLWSIDFARGTTATGVWSNVPEDVLLAFRDGLVYVNLHTAANPAGELRGQVRFPQTGIRSVTTFLKTPTDYVANLSPVQVVPNPAKVDSRAQGSGTFTVDPMVHTTLAYAINVAGLAVTAAHIHGPAERGVDAPTSVLHVIEFAGGTARGEWTGITPEQLSWLARGLLYVNLHTAAFPQGELRGQIEAESQSFAVKNTVTLTSAKVVAEAARRERRASHSGAVGRSGVAKLTRCGASASCIDYTVTVRLPGVASDGFDSAHFHGPALAGQPGSNAPAAVLHTIPLQLDSSAAAAAGTYTATGRWSPTAEQQAWLLDEAVYINIHTKAEPGGELRGQVSFPRTGQNMFVAVVCDAGGCNGGALNGKSLEFAGRSSEVDAATIQQQTGDTKTDTLSDLTAVGVMFVLGLIFGVAIFAWNHSKNGMPARSMPKYEQQADHRDLKAATENADYENPIAKMNAGRQPPSRTPPSRAAPPLSAPPSRTAAAPEPEPEPEPEPAAAPVLPVARPRSLWESAVDASSGDTYYINTASNETTWTLPEGYDSTTA